MSTVQRAVSTGVVRKGSVAEGKTFTTGELKNNIDKRQLLPRCTSLPLP